MNIHQVYFSTNYAREEFRKKKINNPKSITISTKPLPKNNMIAIARKIISCQLVYKSPEATVCYVSNDTITNIYYAPKRLRHTYEVTVEYTKTIA